MGGISTPSSNSSRTALGSFTPPMSLTCPTVPISATSRSPLNTGVTSAMPNGSPLLGRPPAVAEGRHHGRSRMACTIAQDVNLTRTEGGVLDVNVQLQQLRALKAERVVVSFRQISETNLGDRKS